MRESTALRQTEAAPLPLGRARSATLPSFSAEPSPGTAYNPLVKHSAPDIGADEIAAVIHVLQSGHLAQGVETERFEEELAAFVGRRYAVALNSGTSALEVALRAAGAAYAAIPSYACAALMTAVHRMGATPVLCDVTESGQLDPACVPANVDCAITAHLFGETAELPAANTVIEDIAQAIGGGAGGRGKMTVASFYATKLMTTGEGGALLTDDDGVAAFARDQREYDNREHYEARLNGKMTDMQAALGRVQLARLPGFIARRREIAAMYDEAFGALPLARPAASPNHVYFRYVVQTPVRSALQSFLEVEGIEAKRPVFKPAHHYFASGKTQPPVQLHGNFANSESLHETALSLPIHPTLSDDEVHRVTSAVRRFFC